MTLPPVHTAPERLLAVDGNCALLAAWVILKHFHRRTSSTRLIKESGYTRRFGVFAVALAVVLWEHGLQVAFYSDPDPDIKAVEDRFYRKARRLKVPCLPAESIDGLLQHVQKEHLVVVFYIMEGVGHFSPLTGSSELDLLLTHSNTGRMNRRAFLRAWSAPGINHQCLVVSGRR